MSWPPHHLGQELELCADKAEGLISKGALSFEGIILETNHTFIRQPRFYATVSIAAAGKSLEASSRPDSTLADTSFALSGQPLEQPSMAQAFGESPGTITFGRYVNAVSMPRHPECLPRYEIRPRATDNLLVLQRLYYLMRNGWTEEVSNVVIPLVFEVLIRTGARLILQSTSCVHNLSTIPDGRKEHLPCWKDRSCFSSPL